jgi:hypothetical protein
VLEKRGGERKGGYNSVARGGKRGGLAMARARVGGPGHERHAVGRWQPADGGTGSRTGEAGEEREGREQGEAHWCAGSRSGAQRQREKASGVAAGGPAQREGPTGREKEGEGAAATRGPWGLN